MPVVQPIRTSGAHGRALARRLINASQQPASHIRNNSLFLENSTEDVLEQCVSHAISLRDMFVPANTTYFLVRNKTFVSLYYVAILLDGQWLISCPDESLKNGYLAKVKSYICQRGMARRAARLARKQVA